MASYRFKDFDAVLEQIWANAYAEYLGRDPQRTQSAYSHANQTVERFIREHKRRLERESIKYKRTL